MCDFNEVSYENVIVYSDTNKSLYLVSTFLMINAIHVVIICQMFVETRQLLGVNDYPPRKAFFFPMHR